MRLVTKLTLALSLSFAVIFIVALVFVGRQEQSLGDTLAVRHSRQLGRVLSVTVLETWVERGEAEARRLVREIDRSEPTLLLRWVTLDPSENGPSGRLSDVQIEQLRRGHIVETFAERSELHEDVLYSYVPIAPDGGGGQHTIEIARSLEPRNERMRSMLVNLLLVTMLALLGALLVTHLFGRRLVGRPVGRLVEWAQRVGRGELSTRVDASSQDEFGEVARSMNEMAARLESALDAQREAQLEMLRHAERLAMLGQLAAGAAHEVATPLQVIAVRAEILGRRLGDEALSTQSAEIIARQIEQIRRIMQDMLGFARRQTPRREVRDLREVVEHSLELLRMVRTEQPVEMRCEVDETDAEPLQAEIDAEQIRQVISNLVLNGVQAMPHGGEVLVRLGHERRTSPRAGDYVVLEVEDQGEGIAPEALPRLFEPFFTTKAEGKGTGLGLAICKGIVEEHGGSIEVDSRPGRGTTFRIYLPAHSSAAR